MFSQYGFSSAVVTAAETACEVGGLLQAKTWSTKATEKAHVNTELGTASVAEADTGSQARIIEKLQDRFPGAYFVGEEKRDIPQEDPRIVVSSGLSFWIDSRDGSTENNWGLPNYCVSIGVMGNGDHVGGAIFGPDVLGGFLALGERGRGVWILEHGKSSLVQVELPGEKPNKPVISFGLDVQRVNGFLSLVSNLPKKLRPRRLAGSGALDLAFVAAGRIDAIIQYPQLPWDWIAGYPLVLEAGRKFQCYRLEGGRVVWIEKPTLDCYSSEAQTLGFVAGHPATVEELCPIVEQSYRAETH